MIDFRYHLVSLISVFLALAVGIVLGAGPLRDTISDQLTGQVEQLRQEKDGLRVELDTVQGQLADQADFTAATAEQLLDGRLPEYRVAIVRLPEVDQDTLSAVEERIDQAGAEVVADLTLGALWADPGQEAFRAKAADEVASIMAQTPAPDADPAADRAVLTQGLAEALRGATADDPRVSGTIAAEVLAALSGGSDPLVTGEVSQPADLVLVLTQPAQEVAADATPDPDATLVRDAWAQTLVDLGTAAPTVVAGYDALPGDVLVRVRQLGGVTTTDHLGEDVGRLVAVLALAGVAAGDEPAAYGFGNGVAGVVPRASRLDPPLVLQPTPTPTDPAEGEAGTDGTGEDATPTGDGAPEQTTDQSADPSTGQTDGGVDQSSDEPAEEAA